MYANILVTPEHAGAAAAAASSIARSAGTSSFAADTGGRERIRI